MPNDHTMTINDDNPTLMNGRILEYNEPPHNTLSTAGLISTSGNVTTNLSVINPVGFSNINRPISVGGVQTGNKDHLVGYFSSKNVFNLSHKVLSETEIRILGKGLQFVQFRPKSTWTPPKDCPSLEMFLSQVENELFKYVPQRVQKYNRSKNEWQILKTLIQDNSIIIKPADKGSCVVVWDRDDYLAEGYSQLSDENVYTKIASFSEKTVWLLTKKSNNLFSKLYKQGRISNEELKYFLYEFKNLCVLGRLYLLPKIHKKDLVMYQDVLLFPIVGLPQKGHLNF